MRYRAFLTLDRKLPSENELNRAGFAGGSIS